MQQKTWLLVKNQGAPVLVLSLASDRISLGRDPLRAHVTLFDPFLSRDPIWIEHLDGIWRFNKVPLPWNEEKSLSPLTSLCITQEAPSSDQTLLRSDAQTELVQSSQSESSLDFSRYELRSRTAPFDGQVWKMPTNGLSLGTHPENSIVLPSSVVSQFHCRIQFERGSLILCDLGSTNGTFLDGVRIQRAELHPGALLQIGPFEFEWDVKRERVVLADISGAETVGSLQSRDKKMKRVFRLIESVAGMEAPVCITGESGTGKELVARAIHDLSHRCEKPFVALNAAALPKELIESELFGHEKGAFTGAIHQKPGAFEQAHGGTLFIDEVGDLDLSAQAKLLRVLETGDFRRVGGLHNLKARVRVVSATHKNLSAEVQAGRFREDLFYRLFVIPVELPPLRDRLSDLELLVPHFLKDEKKSFTITEAALDVLKRHSYPGNIRELKAILQRARLEWEMTSVGDRILDVKHFKFVAEMDGHRAILSDEDHQEARRLLEVLEAHKFNQSRAATALGLPLSTLHDKVHKYGLLHHKRRNLG